MFSREQFLTICKMQDALQIKTVGPDWKEKQLDFGSAIFDEAAEALNHYGWKWWAPQTPNFVQAEIELVDILHFAVSGAIEHMPAELIYDFTVQAIDNIPSEEKQAMVDYTFIDLCKTIGCLGVQNHFGQVIYLLTEAATRINSNSDRLFELYVGKNVLNSFRKANGYKEGTYIKTWFGKEDNIILEEILNSFTSSNVVPTPEEIYTQLATRYELVKADVKIISEQN